ncbi:unnamed protein product [Orchesella dallaii]|uniref:Uncharacterized protein n=1 Tax=Orchesella dallaii TaxID=48710 RepID=A0ABP1RRG0_9HEXA
MAQSSFQSATIEESKEKGKGKAAAVRKSQEIATAAGLISGEISCAFCDGRHEAERCLKARNMTNEEKTERIDSKQASELNFSECDDSLSIENEEMEEKMQLLGLIWDRKLDTLACVIPENDPDIKYTKKLILSLVARVFDPIGFLAPALVPLNASFKNRGRRSMDGMIFCLKTTREGSTNGSSQSTS